MTEIDSQKLQTVLSEIDDQNNRNIQNDVPKAYRKDEVIQLTEL